MATVDPLGNTTAYTHNGLGLTTSVTDPLSHTTNFQYFLSDLIGVTDPLGNQTQIFTDGAGRALTQIDPLGHTTKYQYNTLNQITQTTDTLGGVTTFTYDGNGNLLTVQDASQQGTTNKTTYTYDNLDRVATRTDPLSRQESFSYDSNGNVTSVTDRRSKVTTLQYDALNRRTFAGYGTTSGPTYESTISYSYDAGSRLTQVVEFGRGYDHPSLRQSEPADFGDHAAG